ncbi:MAG: hypothetical protein EXR69_12630, partial [Myxococcales bacterium]|nr:hypothetical protein [Myxococcales bacterium]
GDGITDFMFGGSYDSSYYPFGRSYLVDGGAGVTGSTDADNVNTQFSTDDDYDSPNMSAIGDMDGIGDVVIGSDYDEGSDTSSGSLAVFVGGALTGDLDLEDADDRIYGGDDYDYLGCSLTLADLDDDGYDDIVAGASGYDGSSSSIGAVFIVQGNGLAVWSSTVDSAAAGSVIGDSRSLGLGADTLAHPGDLDGDGNLDLVVTSESDGSAWVFMSASAIAAGTEVSDATHTVSGTAGDMGSMVVMDSDLDNDGADDLVVGADGDSTNGSHSGTVYIFRDASTWAVDLTAADASATLYGSSDEGYLGSGGAGGMDMDGDGIEDVVIGSSSNDDNYSNAGAVFVVPGW